MNTKIASNLKTNDAAYIPVSRSIFLPPRLPVKHLPSLHFRVFDLFSTLFFRFLPINPKMNTKIASNLKTNDAAYLPGSVRLWRFINFRIRRCVSRDIVF